jgi:hypothetical protein
MEIVAIVGDAGIWCLHCARKRYGQAAIDRVVSGDGAPSMRDYGASASPDFPTDYEGNYLTGILSDTEDCYDVDGLRDSRGYMPPQTCHGCYENIVADERNMAETVTLYDIQGIARKSGTDEHGNMWTEFYTDYLAEQEPGECSICGDEIEDGWTCLDGGDVVCYQHVVIAG